MTKVKEISAFLRYVINPRKAKTAVLAGQCVVLALLIGCRSQMSYDQARYEKVLAAVKDAYTEEINRITADAEAGIYATQYLPQAHLGEAWPLAQWLDCLDRLYPGITNEAKAMACWVVINRMAAAEYPDDLESVLLQPGQFNEFDNSAPPTEGNVIIASNQLSRYYNGDIRPAPAQAVYMTISSEGVALRDTWNETAQTGHWRA